MFIHVYKPQNVLPLSFFYVWLRWIYLRQKSAETRVCSNTCLIFTHLHAWSLHALYVPLYLSRVTHAHWLCEFALRATQREWKEYKRALNKQKGWKKRDDQSDRQSGGRGGERRQTGNKKKSRRRNGWDSLNSRTEHARSPCGLLMGRGREENCWGAQQGSVKSTP